MSAPSNFGLDTYFSDWRPSFPREKPDSALERIIRQLVDPDTEERTRQTVKQWNLTFRETIRRVTGLSFTVADEAKEIPVKVAGGLPKPFQDVIKAFYQPAVWWLALRRPLLEQSLGGLKQVSDNFETAIKVLPKKFPYDNDEWLEDFVGNLSNTQSFIEDLLQIEDIKNLEAKLKGIDSDVLGAYFFVRPDIEIYWMVIGVYADFLGVQVEDLTAVVLIHALAHAYTHRGRDIDGVAWDTESFAESDPLIVEGIAQFYTRTVCALLSSRIPGILSAFERLLALQHPVYFDFLKRLGEGKTFFRVGETVRSAMVEYRSGEVRPYEQFLELVEREARRIGRDARAGASERALKR